NTLLQVQRELKDIDFPLTVQLFSALKKTGIDEVHQALDLLFNPVEQSQVEWE
ncbi:MAG: putative GTP-binding protein EngB, partial [Methylococcaceae bacterium NSM2-1]